MSAPAKCGCTYERNAERFAKMCPTHQAEWQETHDRWNADHRAAHPLTVDAGIEGQGDTR
jgi:hypothetical protein